MAQTKGCLNTAVCENIDEDDDDDELMNKSIKVKLGDSEMSLFVLDLRTSIKKVIINLDRGDM